MAQTDQAILQQLQQTANLVRSNYSTAQSMLSIAQMANDSQAYQLAQYEMKYHEQAYNYLESLARNPGQLRDPAAARDFNAKYWEYCYRSKHRDYRSYQEIQPALQQWIAQRQWEVSTPEGRQAWQNQQQQAWNNFNANQARHRQANANFDNYMQGLRNASNQRDKYHHQYVNTIHDRYEWVNPNTGNSYVYPSSVNHPANPDGSNTPMVPYQNY